MKKIILTAVTALLLTSCTDFLDVKPMGRTIPKTAEEYAALLHTWLNKVDQGEKNFLVYTSSQILDYEMGGGDDFETVLTAPEGRSLSTYIGSFLGSGNITTYSMPYQVIRDCNIIINSMNDDGSELYRQTLGTAYAMRGVAYLHLMRLYCEAPQQGKFDSQLGLQLVTDFDMEARPIRSSLAATIAQIESDFQKAISMKCNDKLYIFTEPVAKAYLARLYFWTEQWTKALPLAQELLKDYPLLDGEDYTEMVQQPIAKQGNHILTGNLALSASGAQETSSNVLAAGYRPVSVRFLHHFAAGEDSTDVRYKLYLAKERKTIKPYFCGIRSAEMHLIATECQYHLGKTEEALQGVNTLRKLRIKDVEPYTMSSLPDKVANERIEVDAEGKPLTKLLAAILSERRKELFFEGDRMFELKRNGTPTFWTAYNGRKYTTLPFMYTFPIPESEIRMTKGMIQNEGYTETISN